MDISLRVWRQAHADAPGGFTTYEAKGVSPEASFLEMLDVINDDLTLKGEEPIAFEHDCREGICGSCGMVVNGAPHGDKPEITVCQLHMRSFNDGDEIWVEPWRANAFPVIRDLVVDRSALDRIIQQGGFITARTGSAPMLLLTSSAAAASTVFLGRVVTSFTPFRPRISLTSIAFLLRLRTSRTPAVQVHIRKIPYKIL